MTRPIVLISLDGLTEQQLASVFERMQRHGLQQPKKKSLISGTDFLPPTALWAELLTGRPWYENGCYSQSQVAGNHNRIQPMTESSLRCPVVIPNDDMTLTYSVPLLEKRERLWFGDGSFPCARSISDKVGISKELADEYRAKPFSSLSNAITDSVKAKHLVLDVELSNLRVLQAAIELKGAALNTTLVRIRAFDVLMHLVGPHFMNAESKFSKKFDDVCRALTSLIDAIRMRTPNVSVWLMSLFGHGPCTGRFNLHRFVEQIGIPIQQQPQSVTLQQQALKALGKPQAVQEVKILSSHPDSQIAIQGNFVFQTAYGTSNFASEGRFVEAIASRIEERVSEVSSLAHVIRFYKYDWWQLLNDRPAPLLYVHVPLYEPTTDQTVVVDRTIHSPTMHDNTGTIWSLDHDIDFPNAVKPCHVLKLISERR